MGRREDTELDRELAVLPPELRWREWMRRIEAVLFASSAPVAREDLARVVGQGASVDLLIGLAMLFAAAMRAGVSRAPKALMSPFVIAIAIVSLPSYVRLTRAAVMGELNRDYVTAARLAGASLPRLMFVTVLPNCMAPLIVQATLSFSSAILDAAALGFLGLGVQPPTPEWGTMLASARDYIERAWWVVSLPGLTILLSVLAINLMGDGLRDALDPKLKNAA